MKRFIYETKPLALPQNMVSGEKYRFTVLTPSLIRMTVSRGYLKTVQARVFFSEISRKTSSRRNTGRAL